MTEQTQPTDALRNSLWLALDHTMLRYLLSCSHGRWDGAEKATRHIELCNHYVATFLGGSLDDAMGDHEAAWTAVHEATQELTDNLDTAIGFPLDSRPDYETLVPKFFEEFHRLATGALAKWGTPAGAGEVVAWVDERAINWLQNSRAHSGSITTTLCKAKSVGRPMPLYGEAQAGAVPLTEQQMDAIWEECKFDNGDEWSIHWTSAVRAAERLHGIKGADHG